jgi:hypothetical protein
LDPTEQVFEAAVLALEQLGKQAESDVTVVQAIVHLVGNYGMA